MHVVNKVCIYLNAVLLETPRTISVTTSCESYLKRCFSDHRYNNLTGIGNGSTSRDLLLCICYGERQNYLKISVLRLSDLPFSYGE